jgi:hypothetical protein
MWNQHKSTNKNGGFTNKMGICCASYVQGSRYLPVIKHGNGIFLVIAQQQMTGLVG